MAICGKRMVAADIILQVMKSLHCFFTSTMSMAIGRPNSAANGQLRNVESAVVKMAKWYFWWNQAPMERRQRYIAVLPKMKSCFEDLRSKTFQWGKKGLW